MRDGLARVILRASIFTIDFVNTLVPLHLKNLNILLIVRTRSWCGDGTKKPTVLGWAEGGPLSVAKQELVYGDPDELRGSGEAYRGEACECVAVSW